MATEIEEAGNIFFPKIQSKFQRVFGAKGNFSRYKISKLKKIFRRDSRRASFGYAPGKLSKVLCETEF